MSGCIEDVGHFTRDNVVMSLHLAVGEVFLFRVVAHVLNGKRGDRWLIERDNRCFPVPRRLPAPT